MKDGDRVRVISGEHKGKTGDIIGPFIAEGLGTLAGDKAMEDLEDRWFVQFDNSDEQDILKGKDLVLIES